MAELYLSEVEIVDATVRLINNTSDEVEQVALAHGGVLITGNYLINRGKVQLFNRNGETIIVASPLRHNDEIVVHLGIGGHDRRICHTLPLPAFEQLVAHLMTMLDLARLEQRRD